MKKSQEVDYLRELAFDLMAQGCSAIGHDGETNYADMGISTYEEAIDYFEKIGWLKKMKGKPERWKCMGKI
jgi:hypothetical protein